MKCQRILKFKISGMKLFNGIYNFWNLCKFLVVVISTYVSK